MILACLLLLVYGDTSGHPAARAEEGVPGSVTIIAIPGLSFLELQPEWLAQLPELAELTRRGAIGAVNLRQAGKGREGVYVSWGAGAPAQKASAVQAYNRSEQLEGIPAGSLFGRYNPLASGMDSFNVIVPEVQLLARKNSSGAFQAIPGTLGSLLEAKGIGRYVWGNGDMRGGEEKKRFAPFMLMNKEGLVPYGSVGADTNEAAADSPAGLRTSYDYLLANWASRRQPAATVLELADLIRLYEEKERYEPERFAVKKREILQRADSFIHAVRERLAKGEELWIISPEVHKDAYADYWRLSPWLRYSQGSKEGLLVSDSTKRLGIVTAMDVSATLAKTAHVQPPVSWLGLPAEAVEREGALSDIQGELGRIREVYALRPPFLYSYVTYEIIVLLGSLCWILYRWKAGGRRGLQFALFTVLCAPASMLLMGLAAAAPSHGVNTAAFQVALFVLSTVGLSLYAMRFPLLQGLKLLGFATAGLLIADGVTGAHAIKHSVLGYDPLIGARYYGIGNEYMGVLIGAVLMGAAAWQEQSEQQERLRPNDPAAASGRTLLRRRQKRRRLALAIIYATVTAYMIAPAGGAKAGGALTAACGFGLAWLGPRRLRSCADAAAAQVREGCPRAGTATRAGRGAAPFGRRSQLGAASLRLAALAGLGCAGLAALWLFNGGAAPASSQSHVGRAFSQLAQGRFDLIGLTILRKLEMNLHLLQVSAWSKALLASVVVMTVIVLRPRGVFREWRQRYPQLMHGFGAGAAGTIAALLLNDSGIVAAATMIIYTAVPMLLLRLEQS